MYITNWNNPKNGSVLLLTLGRFGSLSLGDFVMLTVGSKKSGYTLVEVLVVVSIMGILSSMGVVGLRNAVINSRVKDYAVNTAAFLERVANESNRLSSPVCVMKAGDQMLVAYVTDNCDDHPADHFDSFSIEAPATFNCGANFADGHDVQGSDWANGIIFRPRIGLSAAPTEGYVCVQYGTNSNYGVAVKARDKNMIIPMWNLDGSWTRL